MLDRLLTDLNVTKGERVLAILSGAGATTLMELFIIFRKMHNILSDKNITVAKCLIDEIITTQEQAGFQMFIARMDEALLRLWEAPCESPYLKFK